MKLNIKDIKLNEHNPRDITPEMFAKLKKSIQEFPQMLETRPLVIDENNVVLGGNMRLRALTDLGYEEIPVQKVEGWSEEQKKEFVVKDNLSYGVWDWELLANSWDAEQLTEWGLEIPNWETEELEAEEDNYQVPDEIETDIQLGDIFQIGEHRLLCGDSTDSDQVAKLMNGEKADMVFTDPPFPNNSKIMHDMIRDIDSAFYNARIVCNSLIIWFWDNLQFPPFAEKVTSKHIWHKTNGWQAGHFETMYCFHNDNKRHEQKVYSVNNVGGENKRNEQGNHPTPKPIKLTNDILQDIGNGKNTILDLFLGSGSTMVAAHQLNRKCYGMELDPKYCQVIIDRMQKLDPNITITKL